VVLVKQSDHPPATENSNHNKNKNNNNNTNNNDDKKQQRTTQVHQGERQSDRHKATQFRSEKQGRVLHEHNCRATVGFSGVFLSASQHARLGHVHPSAISETAACKHTLNPASGRVAT
jgi:hypothetical protein